MENHNYLWVNQAINGYKLSFSIAMLVYQRVGSQFLLPHVVFVNRQGG